MSKLNPFLQTLINIIKLDSRANFSATILSSVIISVILIVTILGALIYRNIKRRSILMGNHRKFSTSRLITIPTMNVHKTHKKILLLWIRDNLDLTQRVDQLKSQLAKHCNAEVSSYGQELNLAYFFVRENNLLCLCR